MHASRGGSRLAGGSQSDPELSCVDAWRVAAREVALWATAGDACKVCGGAGWVHEHEPGCPLEALAREADVVIDRGACRTCGRDYEINYIAGAPIVRGECTACYMDRSRGARHVEGAARRATRRAKSAKAAGDMDTAREHAREAKRLIAILKVCNG